MTQDELIEAVARAIADTTDFDGDRMASRYADSELRDVARAAISVIAPAVLGEAANTAVSFLVGDPRNGVPLRSPSPHEIAYAIHALKPRYEA